MNLASLDMNLLVALDALLSEAHVGRAARRIGLSQPAASHALNRLRDVTGDPLLVRAGGKMQLTPRAEALRAPLAGALEQVRGLFSGERFDPSTSTRRFTCMMPDHVVDLVIPELLERIASEASHVRLDVSPWRGLSADSARAVDIVIACTPGDAPGFHRTLLFRDTEALAVRRRHPLSRRLRSLDIFVQASHVAVLPRGQREDPIDTWLRELGIERRIALTVPGYLQALHVVSRTDLVAFVPKRMIEALEDGGRVELRGFGAFSVRARPARAGRNPRTGESVKVRAKTVPFFKAGKELRARLNGD